MFSNMDLKPLKSPDYLILFCTALLILFGLVMLSSASANLGKLRFDDNYFFLKHQLLYGLLPGLIGFAFTYRIFYGFYEKIALPLLIVFIILLLLLFTPLGIESGGAGRWLDLNIFSFQPSEFLKIGFILYLAAWLVGSRERGDNWWRGFAPFISILFVIGAILLKQSSTSTFALLLGTACIMYFVSGAKHSFLMSIVATSLAGLLLISYLTPYRWARIMTYFRPGNNPETSDYHINQALIAIGSGGATGVGFGQSTTKIKYLPEPIGDSIFAIVGEELGFLGTTMVITVIFILIFKIFMISRKIPHKFGQLTLVGFGSLLSLQVFMNIAAISGLIPLTGVSLPFISYGGTGLVAYMTIIGIIANISKYAR